jgi:hypothetical protein
LEHPLFLLALLTLFIVLGLAGWSFASIRRRQKYGRAATGIGGSNDPMVGPHDLADLEK